MRTVLPVNGGNINNLPDRDIVYSQVVSILPKTYGASRITINKNELSLENNEVVDGAGQNAFPIGLAIEKTETLDIYNEDEKYSGYNFMDANVRIKTQLEENGVVIGETYDSVYTVVDVKRNGMNNIISLTLADNMIKADQKTDRFILAGEGHAYTNMYQVLQYYTTSCGLSLSLTSDIISDLQSIPVADYYEDPGTSTVRTFIGHIAGLIGGNAMISDYNPEMVTIKTYDSSLSTNDAFDGGTFIRYGLEEHISKNADGGTFYPWSDGTALDGGSLSDKTPTIYAKWGAFSCDAKPVEITGVSLKVSDNGKDSTKLIGTNDYCIKMEQVNPFIAFSADNNNNASWKAIVAMIRKNVIGLSFTPFTGNHVADIRSQFMDPCLITYNGVELERSYLTDVSFKLNGFTALSNKAPSAKETALDYYSTSMSTSQTARREATRAEKSVQDFTSLLVNSMGMYSMVSTDENGATVYYLLNKIDANKTLEGSMALSDVIYRMSSGGFGISRDHGKTYTYGFDSDGNAILNVLEAIGIRFNWAKGGTLSLGGDENDINGKIELFDKNGSLFGKFSNAGVEFVGKYEGDDFSKRRTMLTGGRIQFFAGKDDGSGMKYTQTGTLSPIRWGGAENKEGVQLAVTKDAKYMSLGRGRPDLATNLYHANIVINNGLDPDGSTEGMIFYDDTRFRSVNQRMTFGKYITWNNNTQEPIVPSGSWLFEEEDYLHDEYDPFITGVTSNYERDGKPSSRTTKILVMGARNGVRVQSDFWVAGYGKHRAVKTEHYGEIGLNAFETATPYFSDLGSATISEDGKVYVYFDPKFYETIESGIEYQVFLTKTSSKDVSYTEKYNDYFIVYGEADATFDWMLCVPQKGCSLDRMGPAPSCEMEPDFDEHIFKHDDDCIDELNEAMNEYQRDITLLKTEELQ